MRPRQLKKHLHHLLGREDFSASLSEILSLPADKALPGLFAALCSCEPLRKWRGVTAMGQVVSALADREMEAARVVMRRFMWTLNDESGGIGWGVPEAMSEVCACHSRLASEYGHIVVSFMRGDGFYLELESLQRGLMWGVGRLAETRAPLLLSHKAPHYLEPYLSSSDGEVRGLAARAVGRLGADSAREKLQGLTADNFSFPLYENGTFTDVTVGALAREALLPHQAPS